MEIGIWGRTMKYILVLIVVSILAGCIDQQSSVISGKPVTDYISLVDNLTAAKLNVTQEGEKHHLLIFLNFLPDSEEVHNCKHNNCDKTIIQI